MRTLLLCAAALAMLAPCPRARGGEALEVYARGDYAAVVELLEPAYRAGEAKIQDRLLLARAYLHLDRSEEGLAVLRSVLESDRENPEANGLTGRVLLERGKHQEAIPYLEHAYRLKQEPAVAAALGQCYHALGQDTQAKVYLEKALQEDVRNPANSFLLGTICLRRGLGALAEKYLLMAQEAGQEGPELHLLLGRAYLLERKLLGPILVRRVPGEPKPGDIVDGHVVLRRIEGVAGRYQVCTRFSALHEGLRVLETRPEEPDGLYMVAAGWLAAGRAELAEAHLARLQKLQPASPRVAELRARALLAAGRLADLEAWLEEGRGKKLFDARTAADFYYRAAIDRRAAGQRAEAIRLLQKAESLAPTSGKVLASLAGLAAAMGRHERARRTYARMVELFPDAPDVDEWRNALSVLAEKGGQR
ncbi:MAG: tetratricopeptide repeat protein [Candidatus Brocadiia bacterium]